MLSEFRTRLAAGGRELLLLDRMLERFTACGLLKARGRQRTDSTHVLAAVRKLHRVELLGETFRAALNAIATAAPAWLRGVAPAEWYERYARRVEDAHLPRSAAARDAYVRTVGADGAVLLAALATPGAPPALTTLPAVTALRTVWGQQFEPAGPNDKPPARPARTVRPQRPQRSRDAARPASSSDGSPSAPAPQGGPGHRGAVRLRSARTRPKAAQLVISPYDADARYRVKRATTWVGYMVHLSETCDADRPRLITHVDTTPAAAHEVTRTAAIHDALAAKALAPAEHLVDSAYVSAATLVHGASAHGITLVGPPPPDTSGLPSASGFGVADFVLDWAAERAVCPRGVTSLSWKRHGDPVHRPYIAIHFPGPACAACAARAACIRQRGRGGRNLIVRPEEQHVALTAARARMASSEGEALYALRAGVEGTISQAVRAFGLRRSRYRGLPKTRVQHAATAAALNLARVAAWLEERPLATTRTSRFARLAA